MKSLQIVPPGKSIYLITDGGKLRVQGKLLQSLVQAISSKVIFAIQLREQAIGGAYPPAGDREVLEIAKELLPLCKANGIKLLINSRVDLALISKADGVHLNSRSLPPLEARKLLGKNKLLAYSLHEADELYSERLTPFLDFATFSPIFTPGSKILNTSENDSKALHGISGLQHAVQQSSIPLIALGGIKPSNASECRKAGASGMGVVSSILWAKDCCAASVQLNQSWARNKQR